MSWNRGGWLRATLLDAERVAAYLERTTVGVVVATIHLGDYLEGLRALREVIPASRPVYVLRRKAWNELEARAFARIGGSRGSPAVLRADAPATAMAAIRALRRGGLVVALYDLPRRYGRSVELDFFGRRAEVVRGPADLALLAGADVLPFFTHFDGSHGLLAQALPVMSTRGGARHRSGQRGAELMQRLWNVAEAWIRRYPSQWSHWSMIGEWLGTPRRDAPVREGE